MKRFIGALLLIIVITAVGAGVWKFKRYINWKLSYGGKVDARIEALESKVSTMQELSEK